ncbi:MAG: FHA domain-containing protein [Candidatus Cloacimonadales bacterium]|jgi:hypothetical protein|nr:FHA domain-containing protein [Candidatus Cloacimonadota bacterium]MDX9977857.1 FHA domain-containing protein [Candidatus Cloacimonadales bacterium]
MKKFALLSELRREAYKQYTSNKSGLGQTKIINQIIGVNTVNKQWQEAATNAYNRAKLNIAFQRVSHLQEALIAIYACEYASKNSGVHDSNILTQKAKFENSYYNTCVEFIESCIHNEKKMAQFYNTLQEAVALLEEYDSKLAKQYKSMLNRKQSLINSMQTIQETLEINVTEISDQDLEKIKSLIKHHEIDFKISPELREDLLEDLRYKMDDLLMYYQGKIEKEKQKVNPSINVILEAYDNFNNSFKPFSDMLEQRRYREFIDQKEDYLKYQEFFNQHFQDLARLYQYHNLPRKEIDKIKLMNALKECRKYMHYEEMGFVEFQEMNPSLSEMAERFDSLLHDEFKDDLVNYYKIQNDLINAGNQDEIIPELIRFIKHLNTKTNSEKNHYLLDKLLSIKDENLKSLDQAIENYLKIHIAKSKSSDSLKMYFDNMLNNLFELGDLKRIEAMQTQKKTLVKAFDEMEQWLIEMKKDFDLFQNLPESNLKYSLKEKLKNQMLKISEALPFIQEYEMRNVGEISQLLHKIENRIGGELSDEKTTCAKLIILDQYTMKNYVVFCKDIISIGRDDDNDIVIPCDWISANHCEIMPRKAALIDKDSTNGTFIDMSTKHISEAGFASFKHFNLAGAFEFSLEQFATNDKLQASYLMKLNRVTDLEVFKDSQLRDLVQSLFNTDFVFLSEHDKLCLSKESGQLSNCINVDEQSLIIETVNRQYVLSDDTQGIVQIGVNQITSEQVERFKFVLN